MFLVTIAFVAFIATFALGYIVLRSCTLLEPIDCWTYSGITGIALLASITFVAFLLHQHNRLFFIGSLFALIFIAIITLWLRGRRLRVPISLSLIIPLLLLWVILVSMQLIIPIYSGGYGYGDWWMHYDITQFYLGARPLDVRYFHIYTIPSRPPFFNLAIGYYLQVFDANFATYQLMALIPALSLLNVFLGFIEKHFYALALYIVACNPFLINMMIYPWPKMLVTAYILASVLCVVRGSSTSMLPPYRTMIGWGIWTGLAMLTHPSAICYAIGVLVYCVWIYRARLRQILTRFLIGFSIAGSLFGTWSAWAIGTYGLLTVLHSSPTAVAQISQIGSVDWFFERAIVLISTIQPSFMLQWTMSGSGDFWNTWLRFFYGLLPGACTLTLSIVFLSRRGWQRISMRQRQHALFGILACSGFIGGVVLQPGVEIFGIVGESMAPIVLLFLIVIIPIVAKLPLRQQRFVLVVLGCEFLLTRGIHTLLLAFGLQQTDANMLLKQQNNLLFGRDIIGQNWPYLLLVLCIGYAVIVRRAMDVVSHIVLTSDQKIEEVIDQY